MTKRPTLTERLIPMSKKLKSIRMFSIIIHSMIGVELLTIPINSVKYASNDGWLSPFIVGAVILLTAQGGFWICSKYPGLNFVEIVEVLYGKVFSKLFISFSAIYSIYIFGVTLRLFTESINLFLLEATPSIIIMLLSLLAVYYCASTNFESICIVFDILLPIVLFIIILLLLVSLTAITPCNLFPPLYKGFLPIIKGAYSIFYPAGASFVFVFALPYFENPQDTKKHVNWGIIISIIIYSAVTCLCIMVFGAVEINHLVFPTLTLTKAIQLESQVFERTESLFVSAWIPNMITTFVVYFFISTTHLKVMFKKTKDNIIRLAQLPLILAVAMMPKNNTEIFNMLDWGNVGMVCLTFVYLPAVILTILIKERLMKK